VKTTFLKRTGGDTLLIFFNGWSRDAQSVTHLRAGDSDVLEVSDYTSLDSPLPEEIRPYSRIHLAAWSLGVWAAAQVFGNTSVRLESALALNGTLRPIDAAFGIAPEIFAGTLANWNEESARNRFLRRMAGSATELAALPVPQRSVESQKNELSALQNAITALPEPSNIYTTAVIGSRDKIIPSSAQKAFWKSAHTPYVERDLPHYPFAGLSNSTEVISLGKN